jgi:hypothetical protein
MERKITVYNIANSQKQVINSTATTLGELKREMSAAGISTADKDIFEGITRTEFKSDDSILPQNVNYKGTVTNDLVIMLAESNKKIKSGASRSDLYSKIKEYNLQQVVKDAFGKNFTQCSSEDLQNVITLHEEKCAKVFEEPKVPESSKDCQEIYDKAVKLIADLTHCVNRLSEILGDNCKKCEGCTRDFIESPYSDNELSEMAEFI